MAHTFTSLFTHLIFSTKHRAPILRSEIRSRLFDYMGGMIRNMDGTSVLINGMDDHVHILTVLPATRSLSNFMRDLKGDSSGWAKSIFGISDFGWQTGYAAFSVSRSNMEAVRK